MKTYFNLLKKGALIGSLLLPLGVSAQDQVSDLMKGSPEDAGKLANAYLTPALNGFGLGLNSGWYNSAKAKNTLRFDLRFTATAAFVPQSDRTFDVNSLGLKTMSAVGSSITPTISGPDQTGARMRLNSNGQEFNLPEGIGVSIVPSPQIQLTVGLPKNIDVSLRYIPKIDLNDFGKVDLFGAGAKIEVLPLILGKVDKIVPVDVAIAVGYTQFNWDIPLEVGDNSKHDQHISTKIKGLNIDAIVSKRFLFFTPFASVGFNNSNADIRALGTYQFGSDTVVDPFTIKQDYVNGLKASVGFQLHLAFFRLYGSYTQSKYGYVNAGIGFGMGK
ncbi:DUF6588 family protein [Pedobacter montanisoli]|uniref:Outer membrane protein beta-barrel domain-containing protein n=1 Tax=Pedobacter montanisoli TaxID=2923277 RepID=A0ABS9ZYG0_9SPHI|nr:DUF6588 family protein [Pedobacter montanisoli]MCJ0743325.1 hypothetical protein [Pedobacter montanisoli]